MQDNKNDKKINLAEAHLPIKPLSTNEAGDKIKARLDVINSELTEGFNFIEGFPKSVSFFGSARFKEDHPYYQKAQNIAQKISALGYAIVTGGGPGIMEAANRGACNYAEKEQKGLCGPSLGITIQLPHEQVTNPYVTESRSFNFFFTRKVVLSFSAETYLFFPGGFGTLDEFFEIITLIQTNKIPHVPCVLVGKDFWEPIHKLVHSHLFEKYQTISLQDLNLYTITDDEEEILEIVKESPMRKE